MTKHPNSRLPFKALLQDWLPLRGHFIFTKASELLTNRLAWDFACTEQKTGDLKFRLRVGGMSKDIVYVPHLFVPSTGLLEKNLVNHAVCPCKSYSETKRVALDKEQPCTHLIVLCLYGHCLLDYTNNTDRDPEFSTDLRPATLQVPSAVALTGLPQLTAEYLASEPRLPGPGDCLAPTPAGKKVMKATRRGWAFNVSNPDSARHYAKMRFLEDGWSA